MPETVGIAIKSELLTTAIARYSPADQRRNHRLGWDNRFGLELNHASSGVWADPTAAENTSNPGKYYVMNGLDDGQGNFYDDLQADNVSLTAAIATHMEQTGGTLSESQCARPFCINRFQTPLIEGRFF